MKEYLCKTINLLITNLNTAILTALSSYSGLSFVLSVINNYNIKLTANTSSFVLNKTILINNVLGFNSGILSTVTITTTKFYCLNVVDYKNFFITNLNSGSDKQVEDY